MKEQHRPRIYENQLKLEADLNHAVYFPAFGVCNGRQTSRPRATGLIGPAGTICSVWYFGAVLTRNADKQIKGIFGMNIDLLSPSPAWQWYLIVAVPTLLLVVGGWILFKYIKVCIVLFGFCFKVNDPMMFADLS